MNKNHVLERLIKEGHITVEELLELSKTEKELVSVPPSYPGVPINPWPIAPNTPYPLPGPWVAPAPALPWTITCGHSYREHPGSVSITSVTYHS